MHSFSSDGELKVADLPSLSCILPGEQQWVETKYPWDELFFCYPYELFDTFRQFGIDLHSLKRLSFHVTDGTLLERQINEILDVCQQSQLPGMADRLDVLAYSMISSNLLLGTDPNQDLKIPKRILSAMEYLQRNFRRPIDLSELMHHSGMSERSFRREWAKVNDTPIHTYLIDLRLSHVRQLLLNTDMSLKEIAENCGFSGSVDVCRHFQKHFHTTPGEFRRHGADHDHTR